MMLIEQTTVPTTALPLQAFKDHLRLGTGFGAETLQDGLLESHLRAAIATDFCGFLDRGQGWRAQSAKAGQQRIE